MVYVGCTIAGVPPSPQGWIGGGGTEPPQPQNTVVTDSPIMVEKPFIFLDDEEKYKLYVPEAVTGAALAPGHDFDVNPVYTRDFSRVRVVGPSSNNYNPIHAIQEALYEGKDVVVAPGIYQVNTTITMVKPGQVLLGLGWATLVQPRDGSACIFVPPFVPGVRVAGFLLQANKPMDASHTTSGSPLPSRMMHAANSFAKHVKSLLEWGLEGTLDPGTATQPGALHDMFVRVGGESYEDRDKYTVDYMMRLHSGNVYGDNLWLWRADHARLGPGEVPNVKTGSLAEYYQTIPTDYPVTKSGLSVTGNDVTICGLAVEHSTSEQVVWNGENGKVYFYQCELPYGVDTFYQDAGYTGYKVDESVVNHELVAPGIYCNFRDHPVQVANAILTPPTAAVVNPFVVLLNGEGEIKHILNGTGGPTSPTNGIPVFLS